jgi:soluble lytic murein transglycosylase-like protein
MKHATRLGRFARNGSAYLIHLAHGSLLIAGLFALAWLGAGYLEHESVGFIDTGAIDAHAATLEVPTPTVAQAAEVPAAEVPAAETPVVLSAEMQRVRDYVARRYRVSTRALEPVLAAAERSGHSLGIDPMLIVAVMAIESSFNPFAESQLGAQGLMQVIPRFHMDKIGDGQGDDALFDPLLNIQVGTRVLVEGLHRFGSMQEALQYYGGARSDPNAAYANKVLEMQRRLLSAAGRKAATDA